MDHGHAWAVYDDVHCQYVLLHLNVNTRVPCLCALGYRNIIRTSVSVIISGKLSVDGTLWEAILGRASRQPAIDKIWDSGTTVACLGGQISSSGRRKRLNTVLSPWPNEPV